MDVGMTPRQSNAPVAMSQLSNAPSRGPVVTDLPVPQAVDGVTAPETLIKVYR